MPTLIRCIEGEIAAKGKAYLILEAVDTADVQCVLSDVIAQLRARGAEQIFLASKAEALCLQGEAFVLSGHRFVFETDFWILEKDLFGSGAVGSGRSLRIKKLANWNLELFLALYNTCFFDLPNSKTYDLAAGELLLCDGDREAGFFMEGGAPVGIFELRFDSSVCEIASLGILQEYQGRGFGKTALHLLESKIRERGIDVCRVLCAQSNQTAMSLYQNCGYKKRTLLSSWYRFCPEP